MVRCRLGGNVSRGTRCVAATKGRLGGGRGAAGHASECGSLIPAESLGIPKCECDPRSVTSPPLHRFGVLAPRGKRTVASGLGCGRGWRAQRARAEKNGTLSGAGRAARDTNSGAVPETQ